MNDASTPGSAESRGAGQRWAAEAGRSADPAAAGSNGARSVLYCVIPPDLADQLHDVLRRHFREDPHIDVVVEQRAAERRAGSERRATKGEPPAGTERRLIRAAGGRRAGERRAVLVPLGERPVLPRKARRFAARLTFVERLEPSTQELEDRDTATLVSRFQAGERDAFAILYSRYFDRVYAYMRLVLKSTHEAEDATHEVFLGILEALPGYERRRQPFRAWLFTVVRNRAIDQLRKQGRLELEDNVTLERRRDRACDDTLPELDLVNWITDRDLMLFVERLPLVQRQVLVLRYIVGLTHAEVAQALGRTEVDVRAVQHRALSFLRQRLGAVRAPKASRRARIRAAPRQAYVLRMRRFSLAP